MFPKALFIWCFFLSVAFLRMDAPVASQIRESNSNARAFTDLTFEIAVAAETLVPLQPVPLVLKQSNRTNEPVLGYDSVTFSSPIYFYVKKAGTNNWKQLEQLTALLKLVGHRNSEVLPGSNYESRQWLTLDLATYFPIPGAYELRARLYNEDGSQFIESNVVSIAIREPAGPDRAAYNFIRNSTFQDYLFSGAEFSKVKNTLERLTTLYPNSPYARNASFVLGENYFYGRNYPQALVNLLRLENDNDFIHAEKVRRYLAEIRRAQAP